MYLSCLKTLTERQRRQDAGHTLGEHGLATTRRANHDGVMTSSGGYLQTTLDDNLTFHVGKVIFVVVQRTGKLGTSVHDRLLDSALAVQEIGHLFEVSGAIDLHVVDNGRFTGVLRRNDKTFVFLLASLYGNGQDSLNGTQTAVQPQFTHDDIPFQLVGLHRTYGTEDTHSDGEVISGALFFQVCRRQIDNDTFARNTESRLLESRRYTLCTLFHGIVGQAHHKEAHADTDIHLNGDHQCIDAKNCTTVCLYQHYLNNQVITISFNGYNRLSITAQSTTCQRAVR